MSPEASEDQDHAAAVEALQNAEYYVLAVVTEDGIKMLDGVPGKGAGTSLHEQLCLYSMLEGWAESHRKLTEWNMEQTKGSN